MRRAWERQGTGSELVDRQWTGSGEQQGTGSELGKARRGGGVVGGNSWDDGRRLGADGGGQAGSLVATDSNDGLGY